MKRKKGKVKDEIAKAECNGKNKKAKVKDEIAFTQGGRESAKAERNGKNKKAKVKDEIGNLGETVEKLVKVQEDRRMDLEKAAEAQLQISNTNLKVAM
jgi:hypothetical protein